jgi:hypothetical protein
MGFATAIAIDRLARSLPQRMPPQSMPSTYRIERRDGERLWKPFIIPGGLAATWNDDAQIGQQLRSDELARAGTQM